MFWRVSLIPPDVQFVKTYAQNILQSEKYPETYTRGAHL
jgi:hypothetical protein